MIHLNASLVTVPAFKLWEFAAFLMSYVGVVLFRRPLFSQGHFCSTLLLLPSPFVLPLAPSHSRDNCSKNEVALCRGRLRLKGLGSPAPCLPTPPHASLKKKKT